MTSELVILTKVAYEEINAKLDALITQANKKVVESDKLLSNIEAAAFLKVSRSTLQTYRNTGKLAFVQIKRKILYRQEDLQEFLIRNKKDTIKSK